MGKSSFLAPIPYMHLDGAIEILKEKPFALFGTEAYDFFLDVEVGAKVLIYRSHEDADPVVTYQGIYCGYIGDMGEMRRLERQGFRPETTVGEQWGMYWRCSDIEILPEPLPFREVQLGSGNYLSSYPRGPIEIIS